MKDEAMADREENATMMKKDAADAVIVYAQCINKACNASSKIEVSNVGSGLPDPSRFDWKCPVCGGCAHGAPAGAFNSAKQWREELEFWDAYALGYKDAHREEGIGEGSNAYGYALGYEEGKDAARREDPRERRPAEGQDLL